MPVSKILPDKRTTGSIYVQLYRRYIHDTLVLCHDRCRCTLHPSGETDLRFTCSLCSAILVARVKVSCAIIVVITPPSISVVHSAGAFGREGPEVNLIENRNSKQWPLQNVFGSGTFIGGTTASTSS